jgi:2-keto-3-deoxy-L-arabinonate dehydratase
MQSIEASLTYGKRITARRLGLGEVYDRTPSLAPTQFGLDCATARAAQLPLFPKG